MSTADKAAARRRQELRRSNAAVRIPAAKHKRSRSWTKQQLKLNTEKRSTHE